MPIWNPWRGCRRCSEGCRHCYIHKGDRRRNINTENIVRTEEFYRPVERFKNGNYRIRSGIVYTCFSSDFLIEDADEWRPQCWEMMKQRKDLTFLFLTKRIERFEEAVPDDWGDGYDNVVVCCTVENRKNAERRLEIFSRLPIKHKCITAQPLLEKIDIEKYLDNIELVVAGGESDIYARPLDYEWILDLRQQCINRRVDFEFRQLGTYFIKDGKKYTVSVRNLCRQAAKAGINVNFGRHNKF